MIDRDSIHASSTGPVGPFSERERQVADLVEAGKTDAFIARELGISKHRVQGILKQLVDKIDRLKPDGMPGKRREKITRFLADQYWLNRPDDGPDP